ncbi:hypothetical protein [Cupriavidus basilensis]|uniref:hypothetical protein n=1 Tax=Cupriavidus basilensis TaxID=68895 RepID=UPI0023E86A5A|nr:hypothetical protein [Cupriavidus basilensis]MDF3885453.1 hypothetical protein [Cupriavidus basilensis]
MLRDLGAEIVVANMLDIVAVRAAMQGCAVVYLSVVRFVFAPAATVLVLQGYASLHPAFVLVAVSIAVAATISPLGFLRTRWDR